MYTFLTVLHIIVCVFLMLVVLLQAGRGGGIGLAFGGSGGSQSVFGSSGGANFLTKMTAVCAFIFFANSMALAYMSSQSDSRRLQKIAEKKAVEKKAEEAANAKLLADIEKQRAEKAESSKSDNPPAETPGEAPAATENTTTAPAAGTAAPALKLTPPGQAPTDGRAAPGLKLELGDKPAAQKPAPAPVKPAAERRVRKPVARPAAGEPAETEKPAAEKPAAEKPAAEAESEKPAAE